MSCNAIKFYDFLSEENKKIVTDKKFPTVEKNMNILLENAGKTGSPLAVARCSVAAIIASKYEPHSAKVLKRYQLS